MKIGLALGGGSARGLAHIVMLEAFDELGIKPALIVGCSMGALVGAGYACGMSAKDLRQQAESILTNRVDAMRYVFGTRKFKLGDLLSLKSLTSLQAQSTKLVDLALPDYLAKNVEDTQIPFRVVATNFERMEERVIDHGDLVQAVAASIAIPGLIGGVRIDGELHVDGGVTNPVPFDHAGKDMDIVVAIDVTGQPKPLGGQTPGNMEVAIGSMLIMFNQLAELRRAANPPAIYLKPQVEKFNAGDFFKAREIMAASEECKERLKRALDLRINGALKKIT